jgi:uncharacterized membrane protein
MPIRDWRASEVVQGKPWGHPTHPVFVHFPTALYPAALLFAAASALGRSPAQGRTATILVSLGIAGAIPAALTGVVDWAGMIRGSTKRRAVTRHMLVQIVAQVLAVGSAAVLALQLGQPAPVVAIVLLAAAVATMFAGNWLGGVLVYRMAMRVGGDRKPAPRRAPTAIAVSPSSKGAA